MNHMPFLVDSNVLIDVSRGNVAATAMEKALTLVTLNRKHYQMIDGLQLEVPEY